MTKTRWILPVALFAVSLGARGALFECADPKEPTCTASSEENKKKCPHVCNTWVEVTEKQWLASVLKQPDARRGANFTLDATVRSLYQVDVFPDTPPKMAAVYAAPENFKLKTLPKTAVKEGTLFILPNITGIVKQAAADPLDSIVVYSSAASGGKPNEISLRFLAGDKQPKFVEPSIEAKVK